MPAREARLSLLAAAARARAHVANDLRARKACCPVMHGRLLLLSSPVKQQARRAYGGGRGGRPTVGRLVARLVRRIRFGWRGCPAARLP